ITGEFLSERGSHRAQRPQSWASTVSNESTASARSSSGETTTSAESSLIDPNGNQSLMCSSSPVSSLPIMPSPESCIEARQPSDCDNNVTPSADVPKSRSASSTEEPLDASATPPLNTIVESASQSELLAAI
uniref:Pecanex-like protein n=1 Tax=Ascaris lumbricoides TaxID=6252 RepID=A0A0M3IF48_ASCLU